MGLSLFRADAELDDHHEAEHGRAGDGGGLAVGDARVGPAGAAPVVGDGGEEEALGQRVDVPIHLVGAEDHLEHVQPVHEVELRLCLVAQHLPGGPAEVPDAQLPEPVALLLPLRLVLKIHGDGYGLLERAATWEAQLHDDVVRRRTLNRKMSDREDESKTKDRKDQVLTGLEL